MVKHDVHIEWLNIIKNYDNINNIMLWNENN